LPAERRWESNLIDGESGLKNSGGGIEVSATSIRQRGEAASEPKSLLWRQKRVSGGKRGEQSRPARALRLAGKGEVRRSQIEPPSKGNEYKNGEREGYARDRSPPGNKGGDTSAREAQRIS